MLSNRKEATYMRNGIRRAAMATALSLLLAMLASCGREQPAPSGLQAGGNAGDSIGVAYPQDIFSVDNTRRTLGAGVEIARYYTEKERQNYVTAPKAYMGDKLYIVRNYPEPLPGDVDGYVRDEKRDRLAIEAYEYGAPGKEPEIIHVAGFSREKIFCHAITCADDAFYILASAAKETGGGESGFARYLLCVDGEGRVLREAKLDDETVNLIYTGIEHAQGRVFLVTGGYPGARAVFEADMETGEMRRLPPTYDAVGGYDGERLIIARSTPGYFNEKNEAVRRQQILLLDPVTEETELLIDLGAIPSGASSIFGAVVSIAYSPQNGAVYFAGGRELVSVSLADGLIRSEHYFGAEIFADEVQIRDEKMLLSFGGSGISLFPNFMDDSGIMDTNVVTILTYNDAQSIAATFHSAAAALERQGINVAVELYADVPYNEYLSVLARKLLAGDGDFDLFHVDKDNYSVHKKSYMADLSANPALASRFADMLPGLSELCSVDGQISIAPGNISYPAYRYDLLAAADSGMQERFDAGTLEDFRAFFGRYKNALASAGISPLITGSLTYTWPYAQSFLSAFYHGEAGISDLEALLKELKENIDAGIVRFGDPGRSLLHEAWGGYNGMADTQGDALIALPRIREGMKHDVDVYGYAVNPKSANISLACSLLSEFLDRDALLSFFGNDESGQPIYSTLNSALYDYDAFSGDGFSRYKEMIASGVRSVYNIEAVLLFASRAESYFSGEATLEAAAGEIFRVFSMIRDE